MLKLIITGFIIFCIYRFFIAPPQTNILDRMKQNGNLNNSKNNDDEYINYEEVD